MNDLMDKIVSLCKRRGFVFPGSEIYGGLSGFYDYGSLGVELINNIKQEWRKEMLRRKENIFELDSSIIMERRVWEASGHTSAGFSDPLRECRKCHRRFRADHVSGPDKDKCPECGGKLMASRQFNLLVETKIGPVQNDSSLTYLRGETTQGIYVNYKNVKDSMGAELPFGIAQVGKAFRNEITPRHFIFRMREFTQMEQQYFVRPEEADKYFDFWKKERMKWYLGLGVKRENLRFRKHAKKELAHYAKAAADIEYKFPFGWSEIEGIHNRGDWDLSRHSQFSGRDLSETDEKTGKKFYPYIIETSSGVDRSMLVCLTEAYDDSDRKRFVLKLHPRLASYKAAVFPLLANKLGLVKLARKVYEDLRKEFAVAWDDRGNIGKRYYSQDEIGTPFCITCDFQSLEDKTVTLRHRDTTKQERVKITDLQEWLKKQF